MCIICTEKIIKLYLEGHTTEINARRFHIHGWTKDMNKQFTYEESRIMGKHMKRSSPSGLIKDIQIKTRYSFTPIKLEKIRMAENTKCWQRYNAMKAVIWCHWEIIFVLLFGKQSGNI